MGARPFMDLLREQRNGRLHDLLTEKMQELVQSVVEERKGGTLTMTLTVTPKGDGAVLLSDKVAIKTPEPARGESLFFVTPENNLERQDPRQREMELRPVGLTDSSAPRAINI